MPVLLLARGDVEARDLLKRAIEASYGVNPPALEYLKAHIVGKLYRKIGPLSVWLPVEMTARFHFLKKMRWDVQPRLLGMPLRGANERFDGACYGYQLGTGPVTTVPDLNTSARQRLWAAAALMLTPLSDPEVEVQVTGEKQFEARHTRLDTVATIALQEDYRVVRIDATCVNPETQKLSTLNFRLSSERIEVNGIIFGKTISVYWDETPYFIGTPTIGDKTTIWGDEVFATSNS